MSVIHVKSGIQRVTNVKMGIVCKEGPNVTTILILATKHAKACRY